jgi:LmbE family N-acetylglucosaminyl deacetylase
MSLLMLSAGIVMTACAQDSIAPDLPAPDARMKTDILLVVAHPDDETAIGSYLARAVFDDHRRVAIVYCNRGTGGGNTAGGEQSNAMGLIREIEARTATASFGITNVWFLNGRDTPGQSLFQSLQAWQHGAVLEDVVRIVRLTRPEVVFTWMPHFVSGENHGDHQAAGVIATQAFDVSGDPTVFPAQVAPARERTDINNYTEGLTPWQPKKLYFFSDASHEVRGVGPAFSMREISSSQLKPYYELAARLHLPHQTQGDVSESAEKAIRTGKYKEFTSWLEKIHLIFGKSVVPCTPDGDVFEGITPAAAVYAPPPGYTPESRHGVTVELGGIFRFYRDFWKAHGIDQIGPLVAPEIEVAAGSYLYIPILLQNAGIDSVIIQLSSQLETGWKEEGGSALYRLGPRSSYPAATYVRCPLTPTGAPVRVEWLARVAGTHLGSVSMDVRVVEWTLPQ